MRPPSRTSSRRLVSVVAGAAAFLLVAAVAVMAPVAADSEAEFLDGDTGRDISGTWPGGTLTNDFAGLLAVEIGGTETHAYCIEIDEWIEVGDVSEEVTWAETGVANLDIVASILAGYDAAVLGTGPDGFQLVGDVNDQAAAVQAAIWHYTDGFDLTTGGNVGAGYASILAAVAADALPTAPEPDPTLQITPANQTAAAGSVAGPFSIAGTASAVTVTPTGADLVSWPDGAPLGADVAVPGQFGLLSNSEGGASVSASGSGVISRGQTYTAPGIQAFIIGRSVTATVTAAATATFGPFVGSITLEKTVVGDVNLDGTPRPTSFTFDIVGPDDFADSITLPIGDSWTYTWTDLAAGDYTITEQPAGQPSEPVDGLPATVTVGPGVAQAVTVVAVNTYDDEEEEPTTTTTAPTTTTTAPETTTTVPETTTTVPEPEVGGIVTQPTLPTQATTTTEALGAQTLPRTGSDGSLLPIALGLAAVGGVLLWAGRRPTDPATDRT